LTRALSSSSEASLSSNLGASTPASRADPFLHLTREREHVRPQPHRHIDGGIELARRRVRRRLVEDRRKGVQRTFEYRNAGLINR
jgi:hypothetical protein